MIRVTTETKQDELVRIIEAVMAGDAESFRTIVQMYQRPLLTHATYVLGDAATAEDAVQETFVAVFRYLGTFDLSRSFKPWIFMILKNICKKYRRKLWLRPLSWEALSETMEFPAEDDVEEVAMVRDLVGRLGKEVLGLQKKYREVFVLRYSNNFSYIEIAEALELTVEVVKVRLFRARKLLKEKLNV